MPQSDTHSTLPSLETLLPSRRGDEALLLTIVFHSDPTRIGEFAELPKTSGPLPWVLGRRSPDFGRLGGEPKPLDDPYVSRKALQCDYDGRRLQLRRMAGASRCRLGEGELFDAVEINQDQLRRGVAMLLSHSLVLLLRLARRPWRSEREAGGQLLLGSSARMIALREEVRRAADSEVDVLIRGETGSGKELVATAIHRASRRSQAPLVAVNMAAIPEELAAVALFGNARGAYTGADRASAGYFREAIAGSLFLDEIGDAAASVQPQLLRALQQREIQPVGGAIEKVDVRVISATDLSLDGPDSEFRAALRHRLGACEIFLPSLREHPEDIGELLLYFCTRHAVAAAREAGLPQPCSAPLAIAGWAMIFFLFLRHGWPGNVRQLENYSGQVVVASDSETAPVMGEHLASVLTMAERQHDAAAARPRRPRLQDVPATEFDRAMEANGFEIAAVARQLRVSRAAVYRRIALSGDYRLAADIPAQEVSELLDAAGGNLERAAASLRVSASSLRVRVRELRSLG